MSISWIGALAHCALILLTIGTASSAQTPIVRDSAGARFVSYPRLDSAKVAFELSQAPALQLGGSASSLEYQLPGVSAAAILADGRIVLASGAEVRLFSARGVFISALGRRGNGPGEFRGVTEFCTVAGDSLRIFDSVGGNRLSTFDNAGRFVSDVTLAGSLLGCFRDGSVLVGRQSQPVPQGGFLLRNLSRVTLASPQVPLNLVAVARFDTAQQFVRRPSSSGATMLLRATYPFRRTVSFGISGAHAFVAEGLTFEVRTFSSDGTLQSVLRATDDRRPVTAADKNAYIAERTDGLTGKSREDRIREIESLGFPARMPPYGPVLGDDVGRLWIREYLAPKGRATRWHVFDASRSYLGSVSVPSDLIVTAIAGRKLVAWLRDMDGVPVVRVYELRPKGAG